MAPGAVAEHHRRTKRAAAAPIDHRGHRSHRVAGCVQPEDRIAAGVEHSSIGVGPSATFGSERAAADLHGIERWLRDRADARGRRVEESLVAVPAVVGVVTPPEVVVMAAGDELVPARDGAFEPLRVDADQARRAATASMPTSPSWACRHPVPT